jgi:hypothetical protein
MAGPELPVTAGEVRQRIKELRDFANLIERQLEGVGDEKVVSPIPIPKPLPYPPIPGRCWPELT